MVSNSKIIAMGCLSVGAGLLGAWLYVSSMDLDETTVTAHVRSVEETPATQGTGDSAVKGRARPEQSVVSLATAGSPVADDSVAAPFDMDVQAFDVVEVDSEDDLSAPQLAALEALRDVHADNDLKAVRAALAKFPQVAANGARVPLVMRREAVEALGWYGMSAKADLVPYLEDPNPEVAESAMDKLLDAIESSELGDAELAKQVKEMLGSVSEETQLDRLLNQLDKMRNSVKAETYKYILQNVKGEYRTAVKDSLELNLGSDVEPTNESIDAWLIKNPDQPDDNENFGGAL